MKVILLFDSPINCPTCHSLCQYREYELDNDYLEDGGHVSVEFSDPRYGDEIFIAKKLGV